MGKKKRWRKKKAHVIEISRRRVGIFLVVWFSLAEKIDFCVFRKKKIMSPVEKNENGQTQLKIIYPKPSAKDIFG